MSFLTVSRPDRISLGGEGRGGEGKEGGGATATGKTTATGGPTESARKDKPNCNTELAYKLDRSEVKYKQKQGTN